MSWAARAAGRQQENRGPALAVALVADPDTAADDDPVTVGVAGPHHCPPGCCASSAAPLLVKARGEHQLSSTHGPPNPWAADLTEPGGSVRDVGQPVRCFQSLRDTDVRAALAVS